jgi:uncharacterized membrane protein HdeD (DUF308 family)
LLEFIKRSTGMVIAIGVLLTVLGFLAIAAPFAAGLSIAIAVGLLLLFGGLVQLFLAFQAGSFGAGLMVFLLGALKAFVGFTMFFEPAVGLAALTLVLAVYFVIEGAGEIFWAFQLRPFGGWGWCLASGIAAVVLGIMIWSQFPLSGAWAVGLLVGIKLVFSGTTLVTLGGGARRMVKSAAG